MKLIKLKEDHFVIVDDSEIKEGDWFLPMSGIGWKLNEPRQADISGGYSNGHCKKITHSTEPLELLSENGLSGIGFSKVRPLNVFEVKELIGEVDVEKKVKDYVEELIDCKSVKESERTWISAICYQMYNQAIEDNKEKKYTEEDMRKAIEFGHTSYTPFADVHYSNFIQSLQPKTEWEVEIVDGKLKLKF